MNDGAFLSKMLATQLDRLDLISDIPVLDVGGKDIALKSYEIELKDVTFAFPESWHGVNNFICSEKRRCAICP